MKKNNNLFTLTEAGLVKLPLLTDDGGSVRTDYADDFKKVQRLFKQYFNLNFCNYIERYKFELLHEMCVDLPLFLEKTETGRVGWKSEIAKKYGVNAAEFIENLI